MLTGGGINGEIHVATTPQRIGLTGQPIVIKGDTVRVARIKLTGGEHQFQLFHHQGKCLGKALLKDALLRTAQAADIAGIRCLLVHAKDEAARQWYESWEFDPSPTDPYHLFLMLKDLKALLAG